MINSSLTRTNDGELLFCAKIDPDKVAKEMRPEFDRIAKEIMDEIMEEQAPEVWARVPESVKKITYTRISKDMPEIVTEMMTDIKENIDEMNSRVERSRENSWPCYGRVRPK